MYFIKFKMNIIGHFKSIYVKFNMYALHVNI